MKATRVCVMLAVAWCMQAGVSYAYEDWWDHLSGPGPFWGFVFPYRFLCVSNSADQAGFRQAPAGATQPAETIVTLMSPFDRASNFIPVRDAPPADGTVQRQAKIDCVNDGRLRGYALLTNTYFWSASNRLFPADPDNSLYRVKIMHAELAYAIRLHETLDVGAAVGVSRFSGKVFDPFWRPSLTPLVVRFAPFAFAWPSQKGRAFKISFGLITFFDGFEATDFCNVDPVTCAGLDTSFRSDRERVYRIGIEFNPVVFR